MTKLYDMLIASVAVSAALGIGYVMQSTPVAEMRYGAQSSDSAELPDTGTSPFSGITTLELTAITYTSANDVMLPANDAVAPAPRVAPKLLLLSDRQQDRSGGDTLRSATATQTTEPDNGTQACTASLAAEPMAAAMVSLTLEAPCAPMQRVTLHHNGMMITESTDKDGSLSVALPALTEKAIFMAAFENGTTAMAKADVTSIEIYDRVVVQWQGPGQLQLHALEFGADYGDEGHVWSDAPRDMTQGALGKGGFITVLGRPMPDQDLQAQVYTFPSGTASARGQIDLSVEAEITAKTCGRTIDAQTLQMSAGGSLNVIDVTLSMPECDGYGGFLVLKNLFQDLKIAQN